ncbi:MAG: ribonuclease P protein component [Candidatus Kaiserbacteria bacterium]|nr:ribonuclease P protein component [Candidatus Kaiserbacteria bacterium]
MKTGLSGSDIQTILKKGRRYVGDGLVVVFGSEKERSGRFAVVVSKKVARHSVDRNRIKRLVREAIRSLPTVPYPFVVLCRRDLSQQQARDTLQTIFKEGEYLVS